jgi:hypothetical protein
VSLRVAAFALVVIGLAVAAYAPGISDVFRYDSVQWIARNPSLEFRTYSLDEWYAAALNSHAGPSRRPIAMLSLAANAAISGLDSAASFNATNLALHCLNAILLGAFLHALLRHTRVAVAGGSSPYASLWTAAVAAALFLVHPLQLTAVLHTVQRMTLLAFTFQAAALLLYARGRPLWSASGIGRVRCCSDVTWIGALTILGAFCKENALLTPWLILLTEACFFKGLRSRTSVVLFALPAMAVIGWLLVIQPTLLDALYASRDFSVGERMMTQARVLWIYLYWLVLPGASATGLHHDDIGVSRTLSDPLVLAALAAWIAVACLVIFARRPAARLLAFTVSWYLVAHAIESSVVPLEMVYEHRNYAAIPGFALLVARALVTVHTRHGALVGRALTVSLLAVLLLFLRLRANTWQDDLTLATRQIVEHPASVRSRLDLADAFTRTGAERGSLETIKRGAEELERVLRDDPTHTLAIAKLLVLDATYFGHRRNGELLERLLNALDKRQLGTSDAIALNLLEVCSVQISCVQSHEDLERLLEKYATRLGADDTRIARFRLRYAVSRAGSANELRIVLESGSVTFTRSSDLLLLARWQLLAGNRDAALDTALQIYRASSDHAETTELRRLLMPGPTP